MTLLREESGGGASASALSSSLGNAVSGFIPSIVAIGLIRAWLSFQNGLGSLFETGLMPGDVMLRGVLFTLFLGLFGLLKRSPFPAGRRGPFVIGAGAACSLAYAIGFLFTRSQGALVVESALLCAGYALFTRIWGEDNCSSDFKAIVIRLALSFFVQYAAYSCLLVVPRLAQNVLTAALPVVIALFLGRPPTRVERADIAKGPRISTFKALLLLVVVVLSCFGHGVLFSLSTVLSGTWTLGPLVVAIASLLIVRWVRPRLLLRMMVCLTLLFQCLFAVPSLLSSFDGDWVSILKSFSYAGTMMLTLSFGCWTGAVRRKGGRSVCLWEFAYFVAFYIAQGVFNALGVDAVVAIAVAFMCLILAALIMVSTEWSLSIGQDGEERAELSEEGKAAMLASVVKVGGLTPKEAEVLSHLYEGRANGEVAQMLLVSKNTVRTQVQSIYQKLDVHSREDLRAFVESRRRDL